MKVRRDYGRGSSLESGTGFYKTGRPFSEDATSHSYRIEALRLTWRDLSERDCDQYHYHGDDVWTGARKRPRVK